MEVNKKKESLDYSLWINPIKMHLIYLTKINCTERDIKVSKLI
jgi:hypothetical protein